MRRFIFHVILVVILISSIITISVIRAENEKVEAAQPDIATQLTADKAVGANSVVVSLDSISAVVVYYKQPAGYL